jgi:hypothetical protein
MYLMIHPYQITDTFAFRYITLRWNNLLTRKGAIKSLREPTLFNKTIQFSDGVEHLGLVLDKGLTWKGQLATVINKAYKAFWTCRGMFGKTWGPHVVYWIYTAVIRPVITYSITVWWPRVKLKTSKAELSKLQRFAYISITGALRDSNSRTRDAPWTPSTAFAIGGIGQGRYLSATIQQTMETEIYQFCACLHDSGHDERTHITNGV